jgi:hypothetical protein
MNNKQQLQILNKTKQELINNIETINKQIKSIKENLCRNKVYLTDGTYGFCYNWSNYGFKCRDCK